MPLRLATACAYLAITALLWPTIHLPPIALDDLGLLSDLSQRPFSAVLDYDRFGHLRPLKSALFWVVSRDAESLPVWRAAALGCVLAAAGVGQLLSASLLQNRTWALLLAVCWALHPITASTLSWLSTVNLVLCALGLLGYLYLATVADKPFLALPCLLFAVLSHELGALGPLLWLALAPRRTKLLLYGSLACVALLVILHFAHTAPSIQYRSASMSRWQLALAAPNALLESLRMWFWLPGRVGVLLASPAAPQLMDAALGWSAVLGLGALTWRFRAFEPVIAFALCWVACLLLPLLNFIPLGNTPLALHYLYLPGWGLALLVTRLAQRLLSLVPARAPWIPALALGPWIIAGLPEQRRMFERYRDAQQLYTATLENYPDNVEARVNLAAIHLDNQRYAEAEAVLERAVQLAPNDPGVVQNRVLLLFQRGLKSSLADRNLEAVDTFSRALELAVEPEARVAAGYQLALALVRTEQYVRAEQVIDRLLVEFPGRRELLFAKQLLSQKR